MFLVSRQAGCHPIAQGSPLSVLSHQGADTLWQETTLYLWGRRTVILVIQTLVTRPPLSPAVHLLGVSSELGVLLGKAVCVCVYLEDLPAEILIPLLQITKNCQVFSVQEFL